jgi:anion-transporting  ArsA/GET3 family ATPase
MLSRIIERHRVIVCAGAGGSGKTTMAAAIALLAADRGARAVVVTIDPARRLADALGLRHLKSTPERVGISSPGTLSAMMLEQKPAWDRLIARRAPSPDLRDRILANRFYRRFSAEFAGAHAYAAIDTLCELTEGGDFDTIVLDTPPIRWAIDFFLAPRHVLELLEEGALARALEVYEAARRGASRRFARWVVERLRAATGATALDEASGFLAGLAAMKGAFVERATAMQELLSSDRLTSVLVATPDARALREGARYLSSAASIGVRTSAVVINRTATASVSGSGAERVSHELARAGLEPGDARWVERNFDRYRERAAGERERIDGFLARHPGLASIELPELGGDVHDLVGLAALGRLLRAQPLRRRVTAS